jgi:hypothetical protein
MVVGGAKTGSLSDRSMTLMPGDSEERWLGVMDHLACQDSQLCAILEIAAIYSRMDKIKVGLLDVF